MQWYENDGLWSGFGELMFPERRAVEAEANVADSPLLKFTPGTRVLDLCCGPGIYVVPLARRGHLVTGVDLNAEMLAKAADACADAGVEASLEQADMGDYVRPGQFDVVINMYTSFGYFEEPDQNAQVLRNAYECLVPGGQILLDLLGKEVLASWVGRPQAVDLPDGVAFMRDTVLDDWTRLRTDWTLVRNGTVHEASIVSFVYSAAEMRDLLQRAGFVDVECFGGFDGSAYDNHAKRLIVRGTRPH